MKYWNIFDKKEYIIFFYDCNKNYRILWKVNKVNKIDKTFLLILNTW